MHDEHLRNIRLLNNRLCEIYGSQNLSFAKGCSDHDAQVDRFVHKVLGKFAYDSVPIVVDHNKNPYTPQLQYVDDLNHSRIDLRKSPARVVPPAERVE